MSIRDYSVRYKDGNMRLERSFDSEDAAKIFAVRMNQDTVYRNILVNDSWSLMSSLTAFYTQKSVEYLDLHKSKKELSKTDKDKLKAEVDARLKIKNGSKTCLEKLNELLGQLKSKHKDFDILKNNLFSDDDGFNLYQTNTPIIDYETKKNKFVAPSASTVGRDIVLNSRESFNQNVHDIFHELLHAAKDNNYKHVQIAEAIARTEGLNIKKYGRFNEGSGSDFLNSWIGQYCREKGGESWKNWLKKF